MLETLQHYLAYPFVRLISLGDPFSVYSLATAFAFAAGIYALRRRGRAVKRLRAFARAAFPARIFRHRSSLLDYQLFFATSLIFASGVTAFLISSEAIAHGVSVSLAAAFGPAGQGLPPNAPLGLLAAAIYVAAFDLGYWLAHFLMHRFPALWEFHKVHHSAEVLTPFTEWRQHPIELALFPICEALTMGVSYGALGYLLGPAAQPLTLLHVNVLMLLFMATILHLRHSHLWMPARGWLGHIVQSPAHHQIHHSTDPKHFNKNLGLFLSVWDWAFGTLWIPEKREALEFGLGAESREHDSLLAVYWLPLKKAARHLAGRSPQSPATSAPSPASISLHSPGAGHG
jgi:sterol desaturase/sphingolipid hydroxylase (fatty acid hydroxylase superfamily)